MQKVIVLKIKDDRNIYKQLTKALGPYKEKSSGFILFIVEGTRKNPIIGIRYPGRKVKRRNLKVVRSNSALWANLYDFEVVPFEKGKEIGSQKFTFQEMMSDFEKNKRTSEEFWKIIEDLYKNNSIKEEPPKLKGIDSLFYLLVLKWIWIQEDFNYKFNWEEVGSPVRYVLETRTGSRTARGAGRGKFFAALLLLKEHFTFEEVKKIIPLY